MLQEQRLRQRYSTFQTLCSYFSKNWAAKTGQAMDWLVWSVPMALYYTYIIAAFIGYNIRVSSCENFSHSWFSNNTYHDYDNNYNYNLKLNKLYNNIQTHTNSMITTLRYISTLDFLLKISLFMFSDSKQVLFWFTTCLA